MTARTRTKWNDIVCKAAIILLLLVAVSTRLVTGHMAKYVSTVKTSTTATVAVFAVDAQGGTWTTEMDTSGFLPGSESVSKITVVNKDAAGLHSQVTMTASVAAVKALGKLPLEIKYSGDGTIWSDSCTAKTIDLCDSDASADFYVKVIYPADETSADYAGMVDLIQITVTATQAN